MTPQRRNSNLSTDIQAEFADIGPLVAKAGKVARVLKAISNEKRLLILCKLAVSGECTVGLLAESVGLGQSAVSQHLARLREDNLITFRRQSQMLFYEIGDSKLRRLLTSLKDIYCPGMISEQSKE
jgi:DNA-binding transcriptional ArsR family regulator